MAYVTANELGDYLPQVDVGDQDDALIRVIARAEAAVNGVLGFAYNGYTNSTTEMVRHIGGPYMKLPPHQRGSVTAVAYLSGTEIDPDYWYERSTGSLGAVDSVGSEYIWESGFYNVTANWGYGSVPDDVKEVVLELAVTMWQGRSSGKFSDVVGAEGGGAIGYHKALTQFQRMVLVNARDRVAYGRQW